MGIGRATAHQFAENGARAVYVCDVDATHLGAVQRELGALYPAVEVRAARLDAADEAAVRGVVEDAVARYGRLDVFFANAGVAGRTCPFTELGREEFLKVLDTNVTRYVFFFLCFFSGGILNSSLDELLLFGRERNMYGERERKSSSLAC